MAVLAVLASCAKEMTPSAEKKETAKDPGMLYSFTATAADPMTKAFFKEEEAPSRYIYWDNDDVFDFHDITMTETGETIEVTSSKPSSMGVSKKSVSFEKMAHDYMLISYPKGAVTLLDTAIITSYVSAKVSNYDTLTHYITAKVSVPKEQALSSTLTPANLPMASSRLALSDKAKAAITAKTDTVSVDFVNPVKITPLAGLAKVTITGLPDVESATITKVTLLSEFNASSSSTGTPQRGFRGDNIMSLQDTMAVVGNWTSGDNRFDITLTGGTVAYTKDAGATVCFVANHSTASMKKLKMVVYTSDGAAYSKTFDMSKKVVGFCKSRVSSFTLDFTSGSVSKTASTKFSVEWSKGFLVYDEVNKAYKIGEKDDLGLYFKFGSANAIALYDSNQDWLDRIKPTNVVSTPIAGTTGSQNVTPDGQTLYNGTCTYYGTQTGSAASWRERKYYTVSDGVVTAGTMTSETDYFNWQGSTSFKDNDPCALVKVADGEKAWRLPTLEEVNNLIEVGAAGVEYGNFDGSDIKSTDGKSRYMKYSDGEQEFYLMACGRAVTSRTKTYDKIQQMFSQKYTVQFFTDSYTGNAAASTSNSTNYCKVFNVSLSSAPSITTKAATANGVANTYNAQAPDKTPLWDAMAVRCVRDK